MKKIFCLGDYLKQIIEVLKKGGVVAVPTETVYGFSCDLSNQKAVEKIYQIKGREFNKPLLLIADEQKTVAKYFKLNKLEKELMKKYWPGALTIILILKDENIKTLKINNLFLALSLLKRGGKDIGVRVSGNKIMREIAKTCGGFITSTSANRTGEKECLSGRAVYRQFKNRKYQPDLILDAGKLKIKKPSTIVKVEGKEIKILRQGEIKIKF
jgi:L-threonylcarbamoyladenylate synthase